MEYLISKFLFCPPQKRFDVNRFEDDPTTSLVQCVEDEHTVYMARVQCVDAPTSYILYAHGNSEDIQLLKNFLKHLSIQYNSVVYAVEYTGYGPTLGGPAPSMEACYRDVLTASTHLNRTETLPRVLWGRSMGCAPAMRAASTHGYSTCIIIESAFLTPLMTFIPFHLPFETMFENIYEIERVDPTIPILFIHGARDRVVPVSHGKRLYELCRSIHKSIHVLSKAGHNDIHNRENRGEVETMIQLFIKNFTSTHS